MLYPQESFTEDERRALAPHFTNLDGPVFALVNLPETVKGALFARYSRYSGSLRRLYLDEFAGEVPEGGRPFDGVEGERAAGLYERVFIGYGDDSIAQVGGAHLACEWVSNILTKVLQRGRLAAYLEQSTRYIPYDRPMPGGGYRYYADSDLGPAYGAAMDEIFGIYSRSLERVEAWAAERYPRGEEPENGLAQLDQGEGARPPARPAAGRHPEPRRRLRLRPGLRAAAAADARLPPAGGPFLRRADPRRAQAGDPQLRLAGRAPRPRRRLGPLPGGAPRRRRERRRPPRPRPPRRGRRPLGRAHPRRRCRGGRARGLAVRVLDAARGRHPPPPDALDPIERAELLAELVGERRNRRHRPGRGWEALRYRFEIVSDYGGFRDLQRHRMLTCQWQRLGPELGAGVPEEVTRGRSRRRVPRGRSSSRAASTSGWPVRASPTPPPTRSASATGSATCSTSTPARRCT